MKVSAIIPWGIVVGVYFLLLGLNPVNHNFGQMAPGAFLIGLMVISIIQIKKYLVSRTHTKEIKTAIQ